MTTTPFLPLRETALFCLSTMMPGERSKTARTVVPVAVILFATFITMRSIFTSYNGFLVTTVTPLSDEIFVERFKGGISLFSFSITAKGCEYPWVYSVVEAETMYEPGEIFSNTYRPLIAVTDPRI